MQSIKQNNSSEKKWCVIIPTFNNDKTLEKVLKEVLSICKNIIVVNDGADDNSSQILKNFSDKIDIITHKENQGKGKSLRDAFEYAIKKDGQDFINNRLPERAAQVYEKDLEFASGSGKKLTEKLKDGTVQKYLL